MDRRKMFWGLFIPAFILLISALVTGLGVSPASEILSFQPNTTLEVEFSVINSEHSSFEATLSAAGEFSDIIFFEKPTITIDSNTERTLFKAIFKFPSEMQPGIHKSFIKITPVVQGPGEDMFAAYVAPQIPISLRIPYPGKYADIRLVVLNVDEGTPVPMFVEFDNMGSEKILRAGANIEVYSPNNRLLASLSAPEISVEKDSLGKTRAEPSPILRKGAYVAVVNAYYDEFAKNFTMNFSVGEPLIKVRELLTKKLGTNQINKLTFKAHNEWNAELVSQGFIEIRGIKSEMPLFAIGPDEEKEIGGFLDTTGFEPGEYNLTLTLAYDVVIRTDTFHVVIAEEIIKKPGISALVIILIVLIVAILILVILIIKRTKRAREGNETFK